MLKTYRYQGANDATKELAQKLLNVMLGSNLTYLEIKDALDYAEGLLTNTTKPVTADRPLPLD